MSKPKSIEELEATMTDEEKIQFKDLIKEYKNNEEDIVGYIDKCSVLVKKKTKCLKEINESLQNLKAAGEQLKRLKNTLDNTRTILKVVKDGKTYTQETKKGLPN